MQFARRRKTSHFADLHFDIRTFSIFWTPLVVGLTLGLKDLSSRKLDVAAGFQYPFNIFSNKDRKIWDESKFH